ncbi:MAG: acetyl-CoA carboxylase biotin carboxyl carrier protein [Sarcina sp.]
MNYKELESLIEKINSSDISLFEMSIDNIHLKMDKSLTRSSRESTNSFGATSVKEVATAKQDVVESVQTIKSVEEKIEEVSESLDYTNTKVITSPMVGTFYESPGAGLEVFAKKGQIVKEGDTLCIIEAMKLMNEIEADVAGEIVEILVENGQMVEFGTELFRVRS